MRLDDTIVALSSGSVPSGVAVIRLSGPASGRILTDMLGSLPKPRHLKLADIRLGGETLDRGLVAWMPGPNSFTGEDCAELQVHGSPAVVRGILRRLSSQPGIRLAEAGEFTRRAFENGKLDLVEAQGLGDLIEAETENQRALAFARLEGGLTRQVEGWRERLLDLRAEVEARLDFSDEGDVGELPESFADQLKELHHELLLVLGTRAQGRIMRTGFRVALGGPPNAGKSSLLNALSKSDVAIVSDEPGTTRDLKEVPMDLKGQLVILIDSAGLRSTESKAEALGVERARQALFDADLVLWLNAPDVDPLEPPERPELEGRPWAQRELLRVGTKADIGAVPNIDIAVSTATGEGILELLERLYEASGSSAVRAGNVLVSHERDREALLGAVVSLTQAGQHLPEPELAAEDLRGASAALERLLGRMDAESVLDHLFAAFCIGK